MADREKVVGHLYDCLAESKPDRMWVFVRKDIVGDALALLKQQEADEPKQVGVYGKDEWYGIVYACPYCDAAWMGDRTDTHFCPECGKAVRLK